MMIQQIISMLIALWLYEVFMPFFKKWVHDLSNLFFMKEIEKYYEERKELNKWENF